MHRSKSFIQKQFDLDKNYATSVLQNDFVWLFIPLSAIYTWAQ